MSDRTPIESYADLAPRVDLSAREIDGLVAALNESDSPVLAVEAWLAEKKDIQPTESHERLYRVSVRRETDKAWHVATGEHDDWIPKSQGELFVRQAGVAEIQTPTKTFSEFGSRETRR